MLRCSKMELAHAVVLIFLVVLGFALLARAPAVEGLSGFGVISGLNMHNRGRIQCRPGDGHSFSGGCFVQGPVIF